MKIKLKRGYSIDVLEEKDDVDGIDIIGNYSKSDYKATVIVNKNGIAPTVRENHGQVTGIIVKEGNMNNLKKCSQEVTKELLEEISLGKYNDGNTYGKHLYQSSRFNDKPKKEISATIKGGNMDAGVIKGLSIRKLTPKECWRLMGFDDEDFEKASQVNSNTQLYKQAGNSIVVNVMEAILKNLIK